MKIHKVTRTTIALTEDECCETKELMRKGHTIIGIYRRGLKEAFKTLKPREV